MIPALSATPGCSLTRLEDGSVARRVNIDAPSGAFLVDRIGDLVVVRRCNGSVTARLVQTRELGAALAALLGKSARQLLEVLWTKDQAVTPGAWKAALLPGGAGSLQKDFVLLNGEQVHVALSTNGLKISSQHGNCALSAAKMALEELGALFGRRDAGQIYSTWQRNRKELLSIYPNDR